jgi:putative nucleotidyltransferase with HDIG domain
VLLDLNLPDISGLDVLRKLQQRPPAKGMPHVFVLTASAKRDTVLSAVELGVDAYLLKGKLNIGELVSRVHQVLDDLEPPETRIPANQKRDPERDGPLPSLLSGNETRSRATAVGDLKSMSETASHVITLTEDPNCDMDDIAEAVSQDPQIADKIIRLANTALFNRGGAIDDLETALVRIGIRHTRRAVLNVVIIQHFHYSDPIGTWNSFLFWEHCIGVALIAAGIAQRLGEDREYAEEAFTMGLLHDLGRAVFASEARDEFEQVVHTCETQGVQLHEAERDMLGVDHAEAIGLVLDKWQFAEDLSEIIAVHHGRIDEAGDCPDARSAKILMLANRLANALILGSSGENTTECMSRLIDELGLTDEAIVELCETLPKQTQDLKEGLLDKQNSVFWPDRKRDLRARLKRAFRPLFLSARPDSDRFGIFCEALTGSKSHPNPNLAIIRESDPKVQAQLFRELYKSEKRLGYKKEPLPLLLISDDTELRVPRHLRRRRRIYTCQTPGQFEELVDAINRVS